jgi:hypothetical protein
MNHNIKIPKNPKLLHCEPCDYKTESKKDFNKHLLTGKHKILTDLNLEIPKNPKLLLLRCDPCDYKTVTKKDFNKHLLTGKHKILINPNLETHPKTYKCNCGKEYKYSSSLCAHKKKCSIDNEPVVVSVVEDSSANEIKLLTNLVIELHKQMAEVCQKIQPTVINNTNNTTNSHNKTFNLQFFLNEECKDAMNMSEFIKSIEVKLSDLENIGKLGYVEGMSDMIIKHLKETHINKRPVHCSDAKRETLYIKEENKWEKDTVETNQMFKAVRDVDKKNYKLLANWKDTYPNCIDSKSNQSDTYIKVVGGVMDGDEENVNKVIKKVAKQVVIDK